MSWLKWLLKTRLHWMLACAVFDAALYVILCLLTGKSVEWLWLAAMPLCGLVLGWIGWQTAYGKSRARAINGSEDTGGAQ